MKHGVMCSEAGLIAAHGIVERKSDDHFESWAGGPPGLRMRDRISFDVEIKRLDYYLFQIAGPTSLKVLEKVTGESFHDVGFLRFRDTRIDGIRCEIGRIGMTGGLAYELHGPIEDATAVYDAVYKAGQEFGIERLGWGTYLVNHVEGGFPQYTWTLLNDIGADRQGELMKAFYVSGLSGWLAACCQEALFWISARPIAESGKEIGTVLCRAVELDPIKSNSFVFEAPCFDQF